MERIQVRKPAPEDAAAVESLIVTHLPTDSYGVGFDRTDPTRHVRLAVGDEILGVMALTRRRDPDAVADEMYFFDSPEGLPRVDRYGLVEMGYVRRSATGRGIGSRLLGEIEQIGATHDIDCFVADAWYHGGADSPRRLLEHNGYDTVRTTPFTPSEDVCPKCGPDCRCEGALVCKQVER